MKKTRYDSDRDISEKLNKLVWQSEKEAKNAVTKATKLYQSNLIMNTPVAVKKTHSAHAKDVTKISGFKRDSTYPVKEVGYDKAKSRKDAAWYIHFPDVGTSIRGTVGQPPQHFLRKTHEMSKGPILAIYMQAFRDMLDID
ncbi:hypothetical protein BE24_05300 [Staphylococcus xylosus]|uniref:HK97-gp10 family putative phage morphogenesis protein n=1 Tax=Staphylococcus xylosus TaxID=1288 RepID=UPI00049A4E4E|nr:HK97-gp10 family putative phage morphogenesis protein [Staphylococcus xylosus]AID01517.1 hypothetical protein BE24_05300 [Staphylococcus xylosus]